VEGGITVELATRVRAAVNGLADARLTEGEWVSAQALLDALGAALEVNDVPTIERLHGELASLRSLTETVRPGTVVCPGCGFGNDRVADFCARCGQFLTWSGEKVAPSAPPAAPPPAGAPKARPGLLARIRQRLAAERDPASHDPPPPPRPPAPAAAPVPRPARMPAPAHMREMLNRTVHTLDAFTGPA